MRIEITANGIHTIIEYDGKAKKGYNAIVEIIAEIAFNAPNKEGLIEANNPYQSPPRDSTGIPPAEYTSGRDFAPNGEMI